MLKYVAAGKKGAGKTRWNPRPGHKSKLANNLSNEPVKPISISFDDGLVNHNSGYSFGGA